MSKKSVKRKQNRAKNNPVKLHSTKGNSTFGSRFTRGGTPISQIRAAERDRITEQEAAAFEMGLPEDQYDRMEEEHRAYDEFLTRPQTTGDFWIGEIDTPEDVIKRLRRFPEVLQLEIIHDDLEQIVVSTDPKVSMRLRTLAGTVVYLILFASNPLCTPTGRKRRVGRPRKQQDENAPAELSPDLTDETEG